MSINNTGDAFNGLGLHVDTPPSEWPDVEAAALIVIVGDRQRSGARKLLRRFLGRAGLSRVLARLPGRWILAAGGRGGVSVIDASSLCELTEAHRHVLALSRLVRGHIEVLHALDAETRAAIIADSRAHALRIAPTKGTA